MLSLRATPVSQQVEAYKDLERELTREALSQTDVREIRRRIAEHIVVATSSGPWRFFAPHLKRMERLGYSSMDRRLLVCVMAAQASRGSRPGVRKTAALIKDIERRVARSKKVHPRVREEIEEALSRARRFARLAGENRRSGG